MKAKLTQEMILAGKPNCAGRCPLALLFKQEFPAAQTVNVDVHDGDRAVVEVWDGYKMYYPVFDSEMNLKLVEFINRFDDGRKVKPFFVEYD